MKFLIAKRHALARGEDIVYPHGNMRQRCAHPRKTKPGDTFTADDISGSSAISNLADNVINVEQSPKLLRVTKNRDFGITGIVPCVYDPANRRLYEASRKDEIVYGWDHKGVQIPENQACKLKEFQLDDGDKHEEGIIKLPA